MSCRSGDSGRARPGARKDVGGPVSEAHPCQRLSFSASSGRTCVCASADYEFTSRKGKDGYLEQRGGCGVGQLWPADVHPSSEFPILLPVQFSSSHLLETTQRIPALSPYLSTGGGGGPSLIPTQTHSPALGGHPMGSGSLSVPCYFRAQTRTLWDTGSSPEAYKKSFKNII